MWNWSIVNGGEVFRVLTRLGTEQWIHGSGTLMPVSMARRKLGRMIVSDCLLVWGINAYFYLIY